MQMKKEGSWMNKKAEMSHETLPRIILGVAVFILLIMLFFSLYLVYTNVNEGKEAAKSYLSSLKQAIKEADNKEIAEFNIWEGEAKMVYFGNLLRKQVGNDVFFKQHSEENLICFCYEKGDSWKCDSCMVLKYPAVFVPEKSTPVFEKGTYFKIEQKENSYVFSYEIKQ